jgi:hypothetical protein
LSPDTINLLANLALHLRIIQIALAPYFARGGYFNPTNGGAPVQGMFRQDAPSVAQTNNAAARAQCTNGRVTLDPMTRQADLTAAIIARFNPQTEHPIDVRTK